MGATLNDPVVFTGDVTFTGDVILKGSLEAPAGSITDASIKTSADISASKLQHRFAQSYSQPNLVDVANETKYIHLVRATGTVKSIRARVTTAPTGGDKKFTVDIQKAADGSGTWSSLLVSTIEFANGDANNTLKTGVLIASPNVAAGDAIRVVIALFGTTGSQGQGLLVDFQVDESGI